MRRTSMSRQRLSAAQAKLFLERRWRIGFRLVTSVSLKKIHEMSAEITRFLFWVWYDVHNDLINKLFKQVRGHYILQVPTQLCLNRVLDKDIDELGRE